MSYCSECGEEVSSEDAFCQNCGEQLSTEVEQSETQSSSSNSSKGTITAAFLVAALFLGSGVAATVPMMEQTESYTVEEPTQVKREVPVEYQQNNLDIEGVGSSLNQLTGIGSTTLSLEIRNTDDVGGYFEANFNCQTQQSGSIRLSDRRYIQAGELGAMEATTDSALEACEDSTVTSPTKEVTRTVTKEVQKERTEEVTLIEYLT